MSGRTISIPADNTQMVFIAYHNQIIALPYMQALWIFTITAMSVPCGNRPGAVRKAYELVEFLRGIYAAALSAQAEPKPIVINEDAVERANLSTQP